MNAIERLVAVGIDRESAGEAVSWYLTQADEEKLELYICYLEERQNQLCTMSNA